MSFFFKIGAKIFPDVFAPSFLKGLPPSWSGVINRTLRPPKFVETQFGKYKVTNMSRDEEKRVATYQFQELIFKYSPSSYTEIKLYTEEDLKYLSNEERTHFRKNLTAKRKDE